MATIIYDTRLSAVLETRANQVHQNSPSEAQASTDDMTYIESLKDGEDLLNDLGMASTITPEQAALLFAQTDPELYAFLNGGAK